MIPTVIGEPSALVSAFKAFNPDYVDDYWLIHGLTADYLEGDASVHADRLAQELIRVMINWGATLRRAPAPRPVEEISDFLQRKEVFQAIATLSALRLTPPRIESKLRAADRLTELDRSVLELLTMLSDGLFINCTNATYPMKAMLLLTCYTCAFDGQVRDGAQNGGFSGMRGSRFLMADLSNEHTVTVQKIIHMPYILGCAWNDHQDKIVAALTATGQPRLMQLATHPARVFDILLFMQNSRTSAKNGALLRLAQPDRNWYRLV